MPDIDRLIEAWEIFRDSNPYDLCKGREFMAIREPEYCMGQMIEDTLALLKEHDAVAPLTIDDAVSEIMDKHYERLKEQEAVEPRRDANCVRMFRCGACGEYVGFIDSDPGDSNEQDNYCRNCGKQVKWE